MLNFIAMLPTIEYGIWHACQLVHFFHCDSVNLVVHVKALLALTIPLNNISLAKISALVILYCRKICAASTPGSDPNFVRGTDRAPPVFFFLEVKEDVD
jgi:hypothetical protein